MQIYSPDITGSILVTGSFTVTGSAIFSQNVVANSFSGSLYGTSSWAISASWAPSSGVVTAPFINATFDGQGAVILANTKVYGRIDSDGTISGFSIIADGISPTCSLDIYVTGSGVSLPTTSIVSGVYPSISGGINATSSLVSNMWTSSLFNNDIICVTILSCSVATKINFKLYR